MIPVSIGAWLVVFLFPLLIAAAFLYPGFAVWRFVHLKRHGADGQYRRLKKTFTLVALLGGGGLYVLLALAMFRPSAVRTFSRLVEDGWLALAVPVIFLDIVLANVLTTERALRLRSSRAQDTSAPGTA